MPPQRAADAADARAPRPLLPPQFLAAAAYLAPDLGRSRSGPKGVIVVLHGFPNEGLVQFRLEYLIGKLQLPNDLIGKVFYLNLRHTQPRLRFTRSRIDALSVNS